jgi:ABC-type bacteriocin/lantibiotic exporter with double-glycine peptidase domain
MTLRVWATLAKQFRGTGCLLALSLALSIAETVLLVPVAVIVRNVFDRLIPAREAGAILAGGAEILGLYLASAALGLLIRYAVLLATKRAIAQLRETLLQRVLARPRSYFDRQSLGALHSTIVQDSERLDVMSAAMIAELTPAVVITLGLSIVLLALNAFLFLVLLCVVPALLVIGKLLGRSLRHRYRRWQRAFDTFSTQTQLALRAITLMKASGAELHELRNRASEVRELSNAGRAMVWREDAYRLVQGAVAASAGVIVLVVGGRAVAHGTMTLGQLLSFYAVLALLLQQLDQIVAVLPQVIGGYESVARLAALIESQEQEPYAGTRSIRFKGALAIEDVWFSYGGDPVLRGVQLDVLPGERVSIVGPNGAGKSTLVGLILGLYRPQAGRLLAEGVPFDDLDMRSLRRSIGVLLQEPLIFPASIRDNIAYGRPDASSEEVSAAARWATAAEFIELLPNGYDSQAGDDGVLLSSGQRQRIALARALIARPALIILDEPTTHLDHRSISRLLDNLREFPGTPTILTITHESSVAALGDRAYILRDGRMIDESPGQRAAFEPRALEAR